MALRDRLRRLRHKPPPPTSNTSSTTSTPSSAAPAKGSPHNVSPGTQSASASTGPATPAATQTPVAGTSSADLTTVPTVTAADGNGATLTNANTIEEVLAARTAASAALAASNGEKKKRRGLFRKKDDPYKDWPDDVYKPHEVPPPKYKRTPDPKHVENLHAFTFSAGGGDNPFGKLVRRFSQHSGVSPGGSKWASPFASRAGSRAPSRLASAAPSANPSRNASIAEEPGDGLLGSPGKPLRPTPGNRGMSSKSLGRGVTMKGHDVERVAEEEGENDAKDAGFMSRQRTATDDGKVAANGDYTKTDSQSSHDMPFTEQELAQALTKVTMQEEPGSRTVVTPPS